MAKYNANVEIFAQMCLHEVNVESMHTTPSTRSKGHRHAHKVTEDEALDDEVGVVVPVVLARWW